MFPSIKNSNVLRKCWVVNVRRRCAGGERDPGTCAFTQYGLQNQLQTETTKSRREPKVRPVAAPPPLTGKCDAGLGPSAPVAYS